MSDKINLKELAQLEKLITPEALHKLIVGAAHRGYGRAQVALRKARQEGPVYTRTIAPIHDGGYGYERG